MSTGILNWLDDPSRDRGIRFLSDDGDWIFHSYEALAATARAMASELCESGVGPNDVVAIAMPNSRKFVDAYYGVLLAGGIPAPVVPPAPFDDEDRYVAHTAGLLRNAPGHVVTEPDLLGPVAQAARRGGVSSFLVPAVRPAPVSASPSRPRAAHALFQFSSGSTGVPRATRVSWDNIETNAVALQKQFDIEPDGGCVSWMPFYHDMGLIGGLLQSAALQQELWLMSPHQFLREPNRLLETVDGTSLAISTPITCAGIGYMMKRLIDRELGDLDISNWRSLIMGAERLDPAVITRFVRWLEPQGLDPTAIRPGYGLGEATLAVSGRTNSRDARAIRPKWDLIGYGERLEVEAIETLPSSAVGDGAGWIISCGEPLPGIAIAIEDDEGRQLSELTLGEIVVGGRGVADGYTENSRPGGAEFLPDGRLRTGDAGFLFEGELYMVGRMGDAFSVRGRQIFAEDIEAKLSTIEGVKKGRCIVVPIRGGYGDGVAGIVEAAKNGWHEPAARLLRRELGPAAIRLYSVPFGTIPKTSSGKPRRRTLWQRMLRGETEGELVLEDGPRTA